MAEITDCQLPLCPNSWTYLWFTFVLVKWGKLGSEERKKGPQRVLKSRTQLWSQKSNDSFLCYAGNMSPYPKTREAKKSRVEGKVLSLYHLVSLYSPSSVLPLMSTGQAGVCSIPCGPLLEHWCLGAGTFVLWHNAICGITLQCYIKNHHTSADPILSRQLHYYAGHDRQTGSPTCPRASLHQEQHHPSPTYYPVPIFCLPWHLRNI